jgi:hypothetical protein
MNNDQLQLDSNQIQFLMDYTEKHNIVYKDIQLELVDHLASAVEDIMSVDKKITLSRALYNYTITLPVDFYYRFIEDKSKNLTSFWRRKFGKYILGFFTIPRCFVTILIFLLYYRLFFILSSDHYLMLYAISLIAMLFSIFKYQNYKLRNITNYLVIETYRNGSSLFFIMFFWIPSFLVGQIYQHSLENKNGVILYSASATAMIIYTYASSIVFPKMLQDDLNKKYAHLNISLA